MLCRVADDMFWMSRYVERAITVVRLIDVTWHLELDAGDPTGEHTDFWAPLVGSEGEAGFLPTDGLATTTPREIRHRLTFDGGNPSSLLACIRSARIAARQVREAISSEMWEQLNTLYFSLAAPELAAKAEEDPHTFYKHVREGAQFFQGLADFTLAHDEPWHFMSLGKYLERADDVARVLKLQSHLLVAPGGAGGDELVRLLAVLRSCGSAEAYARFYSLRVEPARVVEFLVLNAVFPQSIRFSVGASARALEQIDQLSILGENPSAATRALGQLRARLEYTAVDEILDEGLRDFLTDLQARTAAVTDLVTRTYLQGGPQIGRLVAASRAAMIMAAQQQ